MRTATSLAAWMLLTSGCELDSSESDQPELSTVEQGVLNCSGPELDILTATPDPNDESTWSYNLKCNATVPAGRSIKKQLAIETSGVTLDCPSGQSIDLRGNSWYDTSRDTMQIASIRTSDAGVGTWVRPENVTVRGCHIEGNIRIVSMCKWASGCPQIEESAKTAGHTQRARDNAPRNILLEAVQITAHGPTPLYVGPGVTQLTLLNSYLDGDSWKSAIYLEAESGYNVIKGNQFHVNTDSDDNDECIDGNVLQNRTKCAPVIAVDGSSNNRIIDNYISGADEGGIFVYRNCGEGGVARWNHPSNNIIINNQFPYASYTGNNPAIFLGSRGLSYNAALSDYYCDDDNTTPGGSGTNNGDFAHDNIVAQNQIHSPQNLGAIRQGADADNSPNFIDPSNKGDVTTFVNRQAGCYVVNGYPKPLVVHGGSVDMELVSGRPACLGAGWACNDSYLSFMLTNCAISVKTIGCSAYNNNAGCSNSSAVCEGTKRIVGSVAACNLELGSVTQAQLNAVPINTVKVLVPSDVVSQGQCKIGSTSITSGQATISGAIGSLWTSSHCHEADSDGGDCHIKGTVYCR